MRILVVGGGGMLGHQLCESWGDRHEVWATVRGGSSAGAGNLANPRILSGVDVRRLESVTDAIARVRPDAVVNAVGIVKQRPAAKEFVPSIEVNALFPHHLARITAEAGARMVHLSTDCVFSGMKGHYVESDPPDPVDLYGRTKLLGEVSEASSCLTLRTSIVGLELSTREGLVEWFLAQRGTVRGFRRAIYSGLTTAEMARAIEFFILNDPGLSGVWHLASAPIDKHALLAGLLARLPPRGVEIVPDDAFACDRSLDGSALRARSAYRVCSWDVMLDELAFAIRRRESKA
jgi:dTDP-4-dehydrorhamnose reductase